MPSPPWRLQVLESWCPIYWYHIIVGCIGIWFVLIWFVIISFDIIWGCWYWFAIIWGYWYWFDIIWGYWYVGQAGNMVWTKSSYLLVWPLVALSDLRRGGEWSGPGAGTTGISLFMFMSSWYGLGTTLFCWLMWFLGMSCTTTSCWGLGAGMYCPIVGVSTGSWWHCWFSTCRDSDSA